MRAVLICNGRKPSQKFLKKATKRCDAIACADGGANIAFELKILPDFIIGDLDSIKRDVKKFFEKNGVRIIYDPDQNSTDIEKAIGFLIEKGYNEIDIVSAIGDRADHILGNLSALVRFGARAKLKIVDEKSEIFFTDKKLTFSARKGETISILPLGMRADGVRTKGLKYKLKGETIYFNGRGISNVAISSIVTVEVKRGGVFVFRNLR